jgi:hypothetical protein
MTNTKAFISRKDVELAAPTIQSLRSMYYGLKEAFTSYSEQLILYYLYTIAPVKDIFATKDLMKMLRDNIEEVNETKESELDDSKDFKIQ